MGQKEWNKGQEAEGGIGSEEMKEVKIKNRYHLDRRRSS